MSARFSILSLALIGLLTGGSKTEASPLLSTQVNSDVDGMSECIQADIIDSEVEVYNNCSGFRSVVLSAQNRREFSYDFPAGTLTF